MPRARSRLGCDECRRRRRKCDEKQPACRRCTSAGRDCRYTLRIVVNRDPTVIDLNDGNDDDDDDNDKHANDSAEIARVNNLLTTAAFTVSRLPNGVPLAPPYRRLLDYFARDVLASLSVHPVIHSDLAQGLVPAMLHEPHLLSAGLALAAAGLASRGLVDVGGIDLMRVIAHLQTSGLSLLRKVVAEAENETDERHLPATCLLWCLADVFAADASASSWRIHLRGIKALLGGAKALDAFVTRGRGGTLTLSASASSSSSSSRSAMGHLARLYLSLQTLPHVARRRRQQASTEDSETDQTAATESDHVIGEEAAAMDKPGPMIDGFLGCSEELFEIMQHVEQVASTLPPMTASQDIVDDIDTDDTGDALSTFTAPHLTGPARVTADMLLQRVQALVLLDADDNPTPNITNISLEALTPAAAREFALCHGCFQQATLVHIYRRLFRLPSRSPLIQQGVSEIQRMASQMTQGTACSTWVAMALPLFTAGCEAFTLSSQEWAHEAVAALLASIGSRHVQLLQRALEDVWRLRERRGDTEGRLCAGQLLDELNYNIILF
ncbi:hypothetical protein SBRCBS47491_009715 [Sporothrix bragantina]|uniref:Zn(2)-C6 fungal-type domain-containing protein n=1 Tax=Sporothrix bragantina TaxID=671064 RepID=A0ABP0CX01_9PEZI